MPSSKNPLRGITQRDLPKEIIYTEYDKDKDKE